MKNASTNRKHFQKAKILPQIIKHSQKSKTRPEIKITSTNYKTLPKISNTYKTSDHSLSILEGLQWG